MRTRTLYATGIAAACAGHAAMGYALGRALFPPAARPEAAGDATHARPGEDIALTGRTVRQFGHGR